MFFIGLAAALVAASPSSAAPGSVSSKQAEARDVMAQIQGLDANLERAVDAYNLANDKLAGIETTCARTRPSSSSRRRTSSTRRGS